MLHASLCREGTARSMQKPSAWHQGHPGYGGQIAQNLNGWSRSTLSGCPSDTAP